MPNPDRRSASIVKSKSYGIEIKWGGISGIPDSLNDHYGVEIIYRAESKSANGIVAKTVKYSTSQQCTLDNLEPYTTYYIEVKPFRKKGQMKEFGKSYKTLTANTNCAGKLLILRNWQGT